MYYFEELSEFYRQRVKYLVIGGLADSTERNLGTGTGLERYPRC